MPAFPTCLCFGGPGPKPGPSGPGGLSFRGFGVAEATAEATNAALALVARDVPLLPLIYGPAVVAHSFALKNYTFSPLGRHLFHQVDLDRR